MHLILGISKKMNSKYNLSVSTILRALTASEIYKYIMIKIVPSKILNKSVYRNNVIYYEIVKLLITFFWCNNYTGTHIRF